jgi:hypothetical protein
MSTTSDGRPTEEEYEELRQAADDHAACGRYAELVRGYYTEGRLSREVYQADLAVIAQVARWLSEKLYQEGGDS